MKIVCTLSMVILMTSACASSVDASPTCYETSTRTLEPLVYVDKQGFYAGFSNAEDAHEFAKEYGLCVEPFNVIIDAIDNDTHTALSWITTLDSYSVWENPVH